ncbi:GNAT family N-acetyltransferase [Crocinitomicaceae bacterium CZZ-1]|uniref:GNAT family N-acetyltransferase n=1 Tax=Taishania pollutisoli TaxID=2766479 RepID=A0A8J6PDJ8_9FLAO|nr:GNAT family N-acetyltransferase [Taishania pollutisoli]MBC9811435.1 GNAT family N-acetyltransferase [Taishania pollutisoli]MBX2947645.1 GNAT family N-acetyltransferase [Crocinitomicaceae bacterium]NGF75220.1 GNAT family N-acetyltransferase [Fluviicola sp. SGL-29]
MEELELTQVTLEELPLLQEIGRATFSETFSSYNSAENMDNYLEEGFSVQKLTEELNNKHSVFYFARLGGSVIGYLKVNFGGAQTELQDSNALEIERIYVLRAYHGKRVGQVVYEKAMELAEQRNVDYVWLGVWEENPRAINFYQKNGFVAFDKHVFKLGKDEQTDLLMKKVLKTGK